MSTRGADRGGSGGGRQSDGHRWGSPRRAMAGDRHRPTPALPGGAVAQPPRRREREEGKAGADAVEAAFRGRRSVGLGREGACGRGEVSERRSRSCVYI